MNRKQTRLALIGVLALTVGATFGLGRGAAVAAKKKGSNKAKTFQNGTQLLIPDDPPGPSFPGMLDATIKVGKDEGEGGCRRRRQRADHSPPHPRPRHVSDCAQRRNRGLASSNPGQAGQRRIRLGRRRLLRGHDHVQRRDVQLPFSDRDGGQRAWRDPVLGGDRGAAGLPGPLNIVDGGRARGTWTLRILDAANGQVGTLNCFKVRSSPGRPEPGRAARSRAALSSPSFRDRIRRA